MPNVLKPVVFAFYYVRMRFAVLFGLHHTTNPLDVAWRWRHFDAIRNNRRNRISTRGFRA